MLHLAVLRGYSWLCTQESLLVVLLLGPYEMFLGIEPGLVVCKASALDTVRSLQPLESFLMLKCIRMGPEW